MAQLGDLVRAKALLQSAACAFGPKEAAARARCVVPRLVPLLEWSWSQPRNHRNVDRVALGDRGQRFPSSSALDGLGALIIRQLGLAAELQSIRHGTLAAFQLLRRFRRRAREGSGFLTPGSDDWMGIYVRHIQAERGRAAAVYPVQCSNRRFSRLRRRTREGSSPMAVEAGSPSGVRRGRRGCKSSSRGWWGSVGRLRTENRATRLVSGPTPDGLPASTRSRCLIAHRNFFRSCRARKRLPQSETSAIVFIDRQADRRTKAGPERLYT